MSKTFIALVALVAAVAAVAPPKGKAFDHVFIVWLENTDYDTATKVPEFAALLPQGVALSNYFAVTHPSEPNYIASSGGDYWGMRDDALYHIPANYTTIVDLLEPKGLTWKAYQEDAPGPCFTGFNYTNPNGGLYVRKHNPFIIYDSIATNPARCANIVPLTDLASDVGNNTLPSYSFVTPNMNNDGHDTNSTFAAQWLTKFLTPLLADPKFLNNTLVVITFDESEEYNVPNRVWTILLGDSVASIKNTVDSTFYTHYSLLSTVEANWGLGNLGRNDAKPPLNNVFNFVATVANVTNVNVNGTDIPWLNGTEPGFLANGPPSSSYGPNTSTWASTWAGTASPSAKASASGTTSAGNIVIPGAAVVIAGFAAVFVAMLYN